MPFWAIVAHSIAENYNAEVQQPPGRLPSLMAEIIAALGGLFRAAQGLFVQRPIAVERAQDRRRATFRRRPDLETRTETPISPNNVVFLTTLLDVIVGY